MQLWAANMHDTFNFGGGDVPFEVSFGDSTRETTGSGARVDWGLKRKF
jgi:hypothetical protein